MIVEEGDRCTVPGDAWPAWVQANKPQVVAVFFKGLERIGLQARGEETV